MKARNLIKLAFAATGMIGAVAANAATNNPLESTFYWDKAKVEIAVNSSATYVAPTNPLQPTYFSAKAGGTSFVATAATEQPFVNARSPLHPSYSRF